MNKKNNMLRRGYTTIFLINIERSKSSVITREEL